jgi:hypothetical protein
MASKSVYIRNYAEAHKAGVIPGKFETVSAGHRGYVFPEVRSLSSRGAELVWQVAVTARDKDGKDVSLDPEWLGPGAVLPEGVAGVVTTSSYQISKGGARGKTRAGGKPTIVKVGKNIGKKNETNPVTQAIRNALGLYNTRLRKSGTSAKKSTSGDKEKRTAHPPPMLVKRIDSTRDATLTPEDVKKGLTAQTKYNGVRLVSYLGGDESVAMYSRTKLDYPGFTHIRDQLASNLIDPPPVPVALIQPPPSCGGPKHSPEDLKKYQEVYSGDSLHLDGEIYSHGKSLQWISGQARREDDESNLDYIVFDCFFPAAKAAGHDMASANRQKYLDLFFDAAAKKGEEYTLKNVKRAPNFPVEKLEDVYTLRDTFLKQGYEGAIVRKDCEGYRYSYNNYHSSNLVKVKPVFDSEFDIVGYTQGSKGKDVGALIWICEVGPQHVKNPKDKTFNVVPKDMSYEDRYLIYRCLGETVDNTPEAVKKGGPAKLTRFERDFKGRPLTVEYPERSTKTGKPTQAKALTIRTYEGDLTQDPLKRLYTECGEKK